MCEVSVIGIGTLVLEIVQTRIACSVVSIFTRGPGDLRPWAQVPRHDKVPQVCGLGIEVIGVDQKRKKRGKDPTIMKARR